jgi:hypothetical protein
MNLLDTPLESIVLPLVGLLLVGLAWHAWQVKRDSPRWPSVQGEIVVSRAVARNETGDRQGHLSHHWQAEVEYRYVVDGVGYTGRRIRAFGPNHFDEASAQAELAPFPAGAKVPVYYQPGHPGTSVLIPG